MIFWEGPRIKLVCILCRAQDDESDTEEDYVNRRAMASSPPPKRIRVVENGPSHSNSMQPDPHDEGLEGMGQADDVKLEESDQVRADGRHTIDCLYRVQD